MNFSLKPNTIIAHFLPGAFFLLAIGGMLLLGNTAWILNVCKLSGPLVALLGGVAFPAALIVGLIFDAVRNSIWETCWDWCDKVEWDIFAHGDKDFLENLTDRYYGFYVFDVNLMMAIAAAVGTSLVLNLELELDGKWMWVAPALVIVVLLLLFNDAQGLRREVARLSREKLQKSTKG